MNDHRRRHQHPTRWAFDIDRVYSSLNKYWFNKFHVGFRWYINVFMHLSLSLSSDTFLFKKSFSNAPVGNALDET